MDMKDDFMVTYITYKREENIYIYNSDSKIETKDDYLDKMMVWEYDKAPDNLCLSNNGGDEDYIIYIGPKCESECDKLYSQSSKIEEHNFGDGTKIIIVAHS